MMKVKSILVSQPEPSGESSPYLNVSKKHKVKIDFRPFIHVEGVTAREVRRQRIDFSKFSSIIFTSRNAVDQFFRLAEEMRFPVPDAMKYFCLSEAIAYYLQKYIVYRKRKIHIGGKTFQDLLPLLKKNKDEKYLLPSSNTMKQDFPDMLEEAGLNWKSAILYNTVCSDLSDLKEVKYDMLVFFSPSGVKSLFENFPDFTQDDTHIAAFGLTTHQAVEDKGLRVDVKVPTPEIPSMAMAIDKYIKEINK